VVVHPDKFTCLICEDVRQEMGGKLTILGFLPGDKIDVPPGTTNAPLNLTFVFVFENAEGDFSGTFSLMGPDGLVGPEAPIPPAHVQPGGGLASVFQFKPTPPLPLGKYVAKVVLNGRTYEKRFQLRVAPMPPSP
jgi:hypothetical protein